MDCVQIEVDAAFIEARLPLTWRDLHFGVQQKLISPDVCIPYALTDLAKTDAPSVALRDLAASFGGDPEDVFRVASLAAATPEANEALTMAKWEFLAMCWYFARWDSLSDPFDAAENVWCDFGHPSRLGTLVRWVPVLDRAPLKERWLVYLRERKHTLGAARW